MSPRPNSWAFNGGAGADTVAGGTGSDIYFVDNRGDKVVEAANGGTDTVHSAVSYTLTANVENLKDVFVFDAPFNAATNVDHIIDFLPGTDTIRLAHADFHALGPGALAAGAFCANPTGAAAHDRDDRVVYDAASGGLCYDANGNALGGATQFATLSPHLSLTTGDFFIV